MALGQPSTFMPGSESQSILAAVSHTVLSPQQQAVRGQTWPTRSDHATPSPPSFHHIVQTALRHTKGPRHPSPEGDMDIPLNQPRLSERATEGASIMELLVATAFGIPRPKLPYFDSGKEIDFVLLKITLENLLDIHAHLSEQYTFQVLIDHLRLPSAYKLAKSYVHASTPYTFALAALKEKYGQPRQLVQSEIASILHSQSIRPGDGNAFQDFALSVRSLVVNLWKELEEVSCNVVLMLTGY